MKPFTLLIKPAGPDCNLACKYCFYSGKTSLFGNEKHRMSRNLMEKLVIDYLALGLEESGFAWQGGEPTLMGLDFYKEVVDLQEKHCKPDCHFANTLQTNGVLLDVDWCKFLSENNWLAGISLDGPKELHDYYRRDYAGTGSFEKIMLAIENCRKYDTQFNILTLLNNKNVAEPDRLFDFFTENKFEFLQFVPCAEKDQTGKITDFSITPKQYGDFLCRTFDRWLEYGPKKVSIQLFDSLLSYCINGHHTICTLSQKCSDYIVVEHNGDVFCCDFFVEERWKIGNIIETPIAELAGGEIKKKFTNLKSDVCNSCFVCRHKDICRGGCLKDRLSGFGDYKQRSYFCESYKQFFDHSLPKFWQIAADFVQGRI